MTSFRSQLQALVLAVAGLPAWFRIALAVLAILPALNLEATRLRVDAELESTRTISMLVLADTERSEKEIKQLDAWLSANKRKATVEWTAFWATIVASSMCGGIMYVLLAGLVVQRTRRTD